MYLHVLLLKKAIYNQKGWHIFSIKKGHLRIIQLLINWNSITHRLAWFCWNEKKSYLTWQTKWLRTEMTLRLWWHGFFRLVLSTSSSQQILCPFYCFYKIPIVLPKKEIVALVVHGAMQCCDFPLYTEHYYTVYDPTPKPGPSCGMWFPRGFFFLPNSKCRNCSLPKCFIIYQDYSLFCLF